MQYFISEEIRKIVSDSPETMGIDVQSIIEIALIQLYADKSNFIICSSCQRYIYIRCAIYEQAGFQCSCGKNVSVQSD